MMSAVGLLAVSGITSRFTSEPTVETKVGYVVRDLKAIQATEPLQDDSGRDWPQQAQVNLTRLNGNIEKAASIASNLERQLAIKSSGCIFAKQAADKINGEIPLAAEATENALMALLSGTKARLTSLNDENKSLGWTGWRGSREEAISELALLSHDIATTIADANLGFARLKNATGGLDRRAPPVGRCLARQELKTAANLAISATWNRFSNRWPGRSLRAAIIGSPVDSGL
jgi:hypothetical protein